MPPYVAKYQGKQLTDNAGGYKGECVSAAKWIQQHDLGLPNSDAILHCVNGAAKDLWLSPQPLMLQYFDKVTSNPQVDDLVVYTSGTYGDVARYVGNGKVFGQLGTPVFQPMAVRNIGSPAGYLRRKGAKKEMITINGLNILYRFRKGKKPPQSAIDQFVGKMTLDEVDALIKQSQDYKDYITKYKVAKNLINDQLPTELQ